MDVVSYIERSNVSMGPKAQDDDQGSSDEYYSDDDNEDPNNLARPVPSQRPTREVPSEWSATSIVHRPTAIAWEKFLNSIPSSRALDFSDICGAGPEVVGQMVNQTPLAPLEKALVITEFSRRKMIMTRVHSHKPDRLVTVWEADDSTKVCLTCQREFSVVVRRHHCRRCGRVYCDDCCNHRMVLPSVHGKHKHRVCRLCQDDIKQPHCIKCRPDIYAEVVAREVAAEEQQLPAPLEQLTIEKEMARNAEKIERQRQFIEEVKRQHLPELHQLHATLNENIVLQAEGVEEVEIKVEETLVRVQEGAKDIEAADVMSRSLVLVPEEKVEEQSEETKRLIQEFLHGTPKRANHGPVEAERDAKVPQTGYTYLSANLPGSPVPVGVAWFTKSETWDTLSGGIKARLSKMRGKGPSPPVASAEQEPEAADGPPSRRRSITNRFRQLSWTKKNQPPQA